MRLAALTAEMVARAIRIYQDLAYGTGRPRRPQEALDALAPNSPDAVLTLFQKEQHETVPGHPCHRYTMRLGNRNYPFMKLLLQEHLLAGEYYFAVDTHDQMEIKPDYPDYEQWLAVRRFNRDLKRQIEQGFEQAGLDTAAMVRRQIVASCGAGNEPCKGLVLIVDDEEDLAAAVEALIQRRGYRTCKVHDGPSGVVAARELLPDLVLLDYELPELDGLQVIERLRADPATLGIPVLLNSAARVSLADIQKADGFLAKPFPESLLHEMMERVLRARQVRP
ncbi:MAG: response regulator [Planctomycetes bacterium]|jgi:CheY-like chemotaxis protein|nr:response regulator [Planctomycetota bacterium]